MNLVVILEEKVIEEYENLNFFGLLETFLRPEIEGRVYVRYKSGEGEYWFFTDYIEDAKKIEKFLKKFFPKAKISILFCFFSPNELRGLRLI
jgi:hypothetical protein